MKTNFKRVSKRSLALILGILMLFSTLMVGTITVNAYSYDCLKGAWNSWASEYQFTNNTCTISLDKSDTAYQFEVYFANDGGKYIYPTTITESTQTPLQLSTDTSGGYLYIKPSVTGDYTFTIDSTNKTLSVTFPSGSSESYTISSTSNNSTITDLPSSATAGDTVAFTVTADTGYQVDSVTMNGETLTLTDGKYTFTMPDADVSIVVNTSVLSTESSSATEATTPVETTTYYIAANELSNWGEFCSLSVSDDGTYSYYYNTNNSLTFKITAQASWNDGNGVYGFTAVTNGFNASDVTLTSSSSVEGQDSNIVCSTNPAYILVYHPNTTLNATDTPIICAATSLPQGGQQYSINTSTDEHSRVVVQSSAAEGDTVSFSLRFDTGYELNTITVAGESVVADETGTYTFTMPASEVTITVTSKASTVVVTNKYYIRGTILGVNSWSNSAAMTISDDGFYEYYYVSDGSDAEFLVDKDNTLGVNGSYNYNNINSKFNGTNVAVTSKYSTDSGNKNIFVESASSAYYVIVYYPNTEVNTSTAPIVCAATNLPSGLQQSVNVVAKDGTITGSTATKFAAMADTTITSSADVTGVTDGTECQKATAIAGKEITITTTIDETNRADYFVKGWVVNGESVGVRTENTATDDGVYTTTFTIDPLWIDDSGNLEITPVFYHTVTDENKDDFITFYVEDFNKGANETWGNTVACYPYYYTGSGTEAEKDFGSYPGQPMLKGVGDRYFVQIAKTCEGYDISGITLNNYHNDSQHSSLSGTTANLQTYDYDDFVMILEAHPDATNIAFKFKFNGDYDNAPSTTSYGSDELIEAAGEGGWEYLKNYNENSLTNIYGADISNDTTNYLRVISNGYDSATSYIGQYATCWYVYAPNASGGWDYVTKIAPSALVFEDATSLGNSDASSFVDAYNALQQYSDYAVQIAYEGNATDGGSSSKRCDGKWYYTIKGQEIIGNILIQYENADIAQRGTYTYDNFTGTGVGEITGANPHFTNADATDPHTYVTTLDNDQQYTFTTDTTTGRYQFIGWYILESEGSEPTFYTRDVDASATRNKSFTFVARYSYVDEIAEIHITYNFKDFQAADGEIAYTTDHDKTLDTANTYVTTDSLIVAYVNNDEEIAKIVKKNVPNIHSDYYDYSLNELSITYSYNASTMIVYATATMDDTPHVYTVTINGEKFTGYYQNTLELYADDFGLTYDDGATALWYLVDGTNETLYYDKFDLNYRFIVDKAELKVVANDSNTSIDGKSVVYNSYYELGYKENVQKITQNFYITDYLDCAYDDDGSVIADAKNITYVGGGILYYSSDENGVAQNETASAALADKEAIINGALGSSYTADKNGTYNKVGYVYSKYDPAKFRYSEFLIAYQHIIGLTMTNVDTNADKYMSAYSYFVYTYVDAEGTTQTQIQISDTMAVATAYEPV